MNVITKLCRWWLVRLQNKKANKKLTRKEIKKRKEMVENFNRLYQFAKWLNTVGLTNRRERKSFWRNVSNGEPVLEKTLKQLMARYEIKEKK